jgi:hypothetical protein
MKKTNKSSIVLLVLLVAVAVTALFVASTYAKYVGKVEGEGTATVAKWNFETDNTSANFVVDWTESYDATTLKDGKIAPGTSGSFDFELKNTSDTGVDFTVSFGTVSGLPKNLKFYKDSNHTQEITLGTTNITGQLTTNQTEAFKVPVYWAWEYYTSDANDTVDTADGVAGASLTIPVTITGVQTQPSTTAITSHVN